LAQALGSNQICFGVSKASFHLVHSCVEQGVGDGFFE